MCGCLAQVALSFCKLSTPKPLILQSTYPLTLHSLCNVSIAKAIQPHIEPRPMRELSTRASSHVHRIFNSSSG